jgi:hypothetical protein
MTPAPRVSRRVIRQRRFIAAAAVAVLVVTVALVVRAVAFQPNVADFSGTWEGSDPSLGSTTLKITHGDGNGVYVIKGLTPAGTAVTRLTVGDDGTLRASGTTTRGAWHVTLSLTADANQLLAEYAPPGGVPTILRFTRATP